MKRRFLFPLSFPPPPSSTNHNLPLRVQPASSSLLLTGPPPSFPCHESRLTNRAFPSQIFADLCGFLCEVHLHYYDSNITSSSDSVSEGLHSIVVRVSDNYGCADVGVFGLDGNLMPPLAPPEVEEGGGEGVLEEVSAASPLPAAPHSCFTTLLCSSSKLFSHPAVIQTTFSLQANFLCVPISFSLSSSWP